MNIDYNKFIKETKQLISINIKRAENSKIKFFNSNKNAIDIKIKTTILIKKPNLSNLKHFEKILKEINIKQFME